jgi:hypothetical protein
MADSVEVSATPALNHVVVSVEYRNREIGHGRQR